MEYTIYFIAVIRQVFLKRYLYQALSFKLSPSNSCLFFKAQFKNLLFPGLFPDHLPPNLLTQAALMPLVCAVTVPGASALVLHCYMVLLLSVISLSTVLSGGGLLEDRRQIYHPWLAGGRDPVDAQ